MSPCGYPRACVARSAWSAVPSLSLYDDILRPSGLRVTQFSILATIARSGEANLRQLEAALAIDQATLTRSLSLLQRDRVIERVVVPRQNLIRLAQEHRDPSVRLQAQDPDPEPGWRGATANLRPAALQGHTGLARRTGSGGRRWTCEARSVVVRTGGAGQRRPADVAMMQAADFGNLHDPARLGELDGRDVRRVLVEREMSASPVIVLEVAGRDAA